MLYLTFCYFICFVSSVGGACYYSGLQRFDCHCFC